MTTYIVLLNVSSCLIITTLKGGWYYHPHFTDAETEAFRWLNNLAKAINQ